MPTLPQKTAADKPADHGLGRGPAGGDAERGAAGH